LPNKVNDLALLVTQQYYKAGQVAGQHLLKDRVLKVVCVNQEVGNTSLDDRCRGITDVLKPQGGGTDVLAVTMDPTDVTSRAQAYLSSHPDIQGVVALGASTVGDPLVGLFRQHGLFGKVGLYTFDISPTTLEAVAKKQMGFALDAQEYLQGFYPVVTLYERALYGFWPTSDIRTGPRVIDEPAQAEKVLEMSKLGVR
jgi:simple sugar transport system substrate-binding protein